MLRSCATVVLACLTLLVPFAATASGPDAGKLEFMFQSTAMFINSNGPYGGSPYYDSYGATTNYSVSAGMGFGLSPDFETGFNIGYGHVTGSVCQNQTCSNETVSTKQWSLFIRHNFSSPYDGGSYAFSGLEFSAVYPDKDFGRITLARPYVGYRIGTSQGLALELMVGGFAVLSGNAQINSGYEVRAGLAMPF